MTVYLWSTTAASNNTADPSINWREGQAPSTVNNSARAMMAAIAKQRNDEAGIITTGGSSTAYTATTNQGYDANGDGHTVVLEMHATNGLNPTLNVDSRGALSILTGTAGSAPAVGSLLIGGIYRFTDNGTAWIVNGIVAAPSFSDSTFRITDNSDATKQLAFELSSLTTATTRTITIPDASSTMLVASNIGVTVQAFDADTLKADVSDDLTVGFTSTSLDQGTKSSGTFTPSFATGTVQHCVNGGAFTLGVPSGNGTMILDITNNGSAGSITISSWTKFTGDTFTTTNGNTFRCYISRGSVGSHLHVVKF